MAQTEQKRAPRLRTLPPVPGWLPEYRLIGDADAIGDDRVALALLLLLRDLRLWVESTPEERPRLLAPPGQARIDTFRHTEEHVTGIAEALHDLSTMRSEPDRATAEALGVACRRISQWAHRRSLTHIALLYAEAAARVAPALAASANLAGRMARIAGHPDRSESWFDYGIRIAGRDGNRNRSNLIRALLGKSTVLREKRCFEDARSHLDRAARLCAATRRHRQAAETQHDLLALAIMDGTFAEAESHMVLAVKHYPIHHPAIPILIHDWCFLLVRQGYYSAALPLLRASVPGIQRPDVQLLTWGTLSRAAAGAGLKDLYKDSVQQIERLVERTKAYAAAALAHAAYGAWFFAEWRSAVDLAARAETIALARGETEVAEGIAEFLSAIREREPPLQPTESPRHSHIEVIHDRIMDLLEARQRPVRRPVRLTEEREAGAVFVPASQAPL